MACAVALANIAIIEKEGMVENAADVGRYLNARLHELAEHHHLVLGVRSLGMLAAFDVDGEQVTGSAHTAAQAGPSSPQH